jgi:hypothetical protein
VVAGRSTRSLGIMRPHARALSLVLLLALSSAWAQINWTSNALRRTVEGWPEPQRSRALPLLDECRRTADSFVQLWQTQDNAAIYASLSPEQPITRSEFDKLLSQMTALFGVVQSVEYRSESLLFAAGDSPELFQHPYAEIDYAVTTTKSNGEEYFLQLYLSRAGGMCRVVSPKYQRYFNAVPPWLRRPQVKESA